jgi:hypothetical protein
MNVNIPILLGSKSRKSPYRKYLDVKQIASKNFPPFYILTASGDFLRAQAYKLKEIFENIGVEYAFSDFTEKLNGKSLAHVFNVVDPFSVYGDKANEEIAKFFKDRVQ